MKYLEKLKLKLQYFGHLMWRVDSLEKTLMLGGIGGRRRGRQRMRWLDGITDTMDVESEWTLGVGDGQGGLACCDSLGCKESDMTEWLNWTESSILHYNKTACPLSNKILWVLETPVLIGNTRNITGLINFVIQSAGIKEGPFYFWHINKRNFWASSFILSNVWWLEFTKHLYWDIIHTP